MNPIEEYNQALLELSQTVSKIAQENAGAMERIIEGLRTIESVCKDITAIDLGEISQSVAVKNHIKNI